MLNMTHKLLCRHEIWISVAGRECRRRFVTSPGFERCDRGRRRLASFVNSSSAHYSEDAGHRRTRGKKHNVISTQSVVAELEDDHLADGWNEVHTNEPRGICAKKNVRKKKD